MNYTGNEPVLLTRDVQVVAVPAGNAVAIPEGTEVVITQSLGGSYTLLVPTYGGLFRLASRDADAIGKEGRPEDAEARGPLSGGELETEVWQALKTCYDPEIPVNIVDLGLVYHCAITPLPEGGNKAEVKMTLTAPGCGMGSVLQADAKSKIVAVPGIVTVDVELVLDPPWNPSMMSEAAKLQLGML